MKKVVKATALGVLTVTGFIIVYSIATVLFTYTGHLIAGKAGGITGLFVAPILLFGYLAGDAYFSD